MFHTGGILRRPGGLTVSWEHGVNYVCPGDRAGAYQTGSPMRRLARPFQIIRTDLRAYLLSNLFVYGLLLAGMAVGTLFPDANAARVAYLTESGSLDGVTLVLDNVWLLAIEIMANNLIVASLLVIILPSLIVPFAGIALFAISLVDVGIILAPVDESAALVLLPHSLLLLVEMQAYVLIIFGAFLLGRAWLRPSSVGATSRRRGYVLGLQRFGWLLLPATVLHIVGAFYEAIETVHFIPALLGS